jgi:fructose-1,6-bisphosphatase/inositol monophosphatase family enzyme
VKSLLFEAAEAVAAAVKAAAGSDLARLVGMGADGTPTAAIDRVAEDAILRKVEDFGNRVNILSEEHEFIDHGRPDTLVVDPIDGTYNALHGIPSFSVALAVGRKDLMGIRYGLVRELVTGEVYYGERGEGAWVDGRPLKTALWDPEESLFDLYLGRAAHPLAFDLAKRPRRVRNLGVASLDMGLVARGAAHLYLMATVEEGLRLRVSDIAASTLFVREAGGEVYDLDRNPLNMPLHPRARSNLLAVGDATVLQEVP